MPHAHAVPTTCSQNSCYWKRGGLFCMSSVASVVMILNSVLRPHLHLRLPAALIWKSRPGMVEVPSSGLLDFPARHARVTAPWLPSARHRSDVSPWLYATGYLARPPPKSTITGSVGQRVPLGGGEWWLFPSPIFSRRGGSPSKERGLQALRGFAQA